jgi:hypothetical protein
MVIKTGCAWEVVSAANPGVLKSSARRDRAMTVLVGKEIRWRSKRQFTDNFYTISWFLSYGIKNKKFYSSS